MNNLKTALFIKYSTYFVAIVMLVVILFVGIGISINVVINAGMSCIEWLTKFILPWIFLFYFIKLVHSYTRSKQG